MKPWGQPGLEITDNVTRQVDYKGKPKIEYDRPQNVGLISIEYQTNQGYQRRPYL